MLYLENLTDTAICPNCDSITEKLHQNYQLTLRDIDWGEQNIYLRVNRRQMRCDCAPRTERSSIAVRQSFEKN